MHPTIGSAAAAASTGAVFLFTAVGTADVGRTVFDGYGQWRNPATGVIGRSPRVKIVLIAVKRAPDLAPRLSAVIDAYKTRFHQQSVGVITRDSCAAF